jgi:GntR family transcriptional regulator/MocR family aminotransferase
LLPALRIGYIAAPKPFIDAAAHTISLIDTMGNTLTEDAAAELIENGELRRHARKVFQVYAVRRLAFGEALRKELGDVADFRMPDGGLAFWLTFPKIADLDRMEAQLPALGVRVADSRSFATSKAAPRGLRIGFASLQEEEARVALRALSKAARA